MAEVAPIQHRQLANGRWNALSLAEQLGNIGSEVGRSIRAKEQGRVDRQQRALFRALELFDLISGDPKSRHRLREVRRAREVVVDFLAGDNEYGSTAEWLEGYFNSFALAALRHRQLARD